MPTYDLWLYSPWGAVRGVLPPPLRVRYRRVVNQTGHYAAEGVANRMPCLLTLPYADDLLPLLEPDSQIEIWRDGQLVMQTGWLIQRVQVRVQPDGRRVLEVGAVPALSLLLRRIVAYAADSPQATRTAPADDLMKALVRENMGSLAEAARDLSQWVQVAADTSSAPVVPVACARQRLLDVLQRLSAAAQAQGTLLAFDLVWRAAAQYEFCTFVGARGHDRTTPADPLVLTPDTTGIQVLERSHDTEDEVTLVYAAGQGSGSGRVLAIGEDARRSQRSPFGRRERLLDARTARTDEQLAAAAAQALIAGMPRTTLRARLHSTPGCAYGQHWHWGDRVLVACADQVLACTIADVQITAVWQAQGVQEQIEARLEADDLPPAHLFSSYSGESEPALQQIQRGTVAARQTLLIPTDAHLLVYARYLLAGRVELDAGARLIIVI